VITRDIRAFMARDWAAARAAKDTYWSDQVARFGSIEAIRMADELRRQAQLYDAGWPHADDRLRDLACHVRVAALFRRADSTRSA
jgi:hypothetical protein